MTGPDSDATRWTGNEALDRPDSEEPLAGSSEAPTAAESQTYWASAVGDPDATAWSGPGGPPPLLNGDPLTAGRVGGFKVVAELGRGGMGVVYRALDSVGREVALKVILTSRLSASARERFQREGLIAAGLRHPGIVRVLSAGEHNDQPFLVYELVEDARPLKQSWSGRPVEDKVRSVVAAARALGHAHAQGIVHRDVKPDNLLVDAHDRVRVSDFGLAAAADLEQLTQTGARLGTPRYMAPEQVDGLRELQGPPTDVWALGVILYQALTGERPFSGKTLQDLFVAIAWADPVLPRKHDSKVDRGLEAVCLQALQADPGARYPDANALADDLERALDGELVQAARIRPWVRTLVRARRWLIAGVALLILALTALTLGPIARDAELDTLAPRLTVEAPIAGQELTTGRLDVVGIAHDEAPWVEVWIDSQPRQRVKPGERFQLRFELAPGAQVISIRSADPAGNLGRPIRRSVRVSSACPEWYLRLSPSKRPPLPLPVGLSFLEVPRTYRWATDGSVLVWVPPGTFRMGGAKTLLRFAQRRGRAGMELPRVSREVQITRGFFIGKYEVTYAQWQLYQRAVGVPVTPPPVFNHEIRQKQFGIQKLWLSGKRKPVQLGLNHPRIEVRWKEAQAYLRWAGLTLPTESEWEYAARGTDGRPYPWGEQPPGPKLLNSLGDEDGYYYTAPVGSFPAGASPFGCLDMAGNVAEMVSDWWEPFAEKSSVDPTGPSKPIPNLSSSRTIRGGAFYFRHSATFHTAMRAMFAPKLRHRFAGFRVVLRHPGEQ